ncbi:uncharacterized protein [Fopius arisanus]|nr:PREDICTED: uncharacterized protein LOC105271874 isoform X2 [Fopius arisanus]
MLENISEKLPESRDDEKAVVKSPPLEEPRRQPGECRLLPVLVDLRSSLETNSNTTCPPLPRGNDLSPTTDGALDLNYFQDLCTTDLKTALSRLEETLKRVDINALTKYTSTLEPSDKFHLLQLISTLVSNLKRAKADEDDDQSRPSPPSPVPPSRRPRRRVNRHTIGVSTEELASARRWLEQERGPAAVKITPKPLPDVPLPEPASASESLDRVPEWTDMNIPRTCDKHIKDAINQKQSLQHKIKENDSVNIPLPSLPSLPSDCEPSPWENPLDPSPDPDRLPYPFCNGKSNKYSVKKSKIKRANTIDIPNYLKMQAEKQKQGSGLRRPIDISDKISWNQFCGPQSMNPSPAIPSFQPKTENDKKFLALITRNNEPRETWKSIPPLQPSSAPFKSFNYRQINSGADKNWKSRFSNIKTAFDKPQSSPSSVSSSPASSGPFASRRNSKELGFFKHEEETPKFEMRSFPESGERVAMASRRFSGVGKIENILENRSPQGRNPAFTHAVGSPFKKFPSSRNEGSLNVEKPVPSNYLPACASGGLLKAKVRMFDQPSPQVPQVPQRLINNSVPQSNQRASNLGNQTRQFKHGDLLLEKINRNNKSQQFYEDFRTNGIQTHREVQVDVPQRLHDNVNQNYQSVAVQTSARSTPKPVTPETEVFPVQSFCKPVFYESENPIYIPPGVNYHENGRNHPQGEDEVLQVLPPVTLSNQHNVENEDTTPDKVITRYAAAIGTVASCQAPESQECQQKNRPAPLILQDDMHHILQHKPMTLAPGQPIILQDDVQRHNQLQLSLIKRMQGAEPSEPLIEINNTQDKINIFEEKSHPLPKINVISPTRTMPLSLPGTPKSSIIPIDSSDEYLVSCSSHPNRSIVLSKSESWHQLALAKPLQHLQVPPPHKPPKSSSPLSQRHSKNFETGSNPNLKRMEEKVQRYFNNSRGSSGSLEYHQSCGKRETRRSFSPKKMPNSLARSHTMPHLFDDNDVDKAFDSLFEETTKDNRY